MKLSLKKYTPFYIIIFLAFIFGGCATSLKPLAFDQDINLIDTANESVAILTLRVANKHKLRYQPEIDRVIITKPAADEKENQFYLFKVEEEYRQVKKEYNEYLISFQLPPGKYMLESFHADSGPLPVKTAHFSVPVCASFELEADKTVYLGHIDAYVKKRTRDDELRAGTLFMGMPCCQRLVGAYGGTFVVEIRDQFQEDMDLFNERYPFLADCEIENKTLSPWVAPTDRQCR